MTRTTETRKRRCSTSSSNASSCPNRWLLCLAAIAMGGAHGFSVQQLPIQQRKQQHTKPLFYKRVAVEDAVITSSGESSIVPLTQVQQFNETLVAAGRDVDDPSVQRAFEALCNTYEKKQEMEEIPDARYSTLNEGDWELKTLPSFPGLLGYKSDGSALFTMGKLTYNMILPNNDANLVCSVQKMTQHISKWKEGTSQLLLPASLKREREENPRYWARELRALRNDVHFTVEKYGVRGILQMDGFTIPNPKVPDRFSVWFTGGRCYAVDDSPQARETWRKTFGTTAFQKTPWQHLSLWLAERIMGAEPAQGMKEDGSLRYVLKRPIGGHETAYQQVLYLDDEWRMTLGNKGTVVVVSRMEPGAAAAVNAQAAVALQAGSEMDMAMESQETGENVMKRIICSETLRAQQRAHSDTLVVQKMVKIFKKSAPKWLFELVGA